MLRSRVSKWYGQCDRTGTDLAQFRAGRRTVKSQDVTADEVNRSAQEHESGIESWRILWFVSRHRGKRITVASVKLGSYRRYVYLLTRTLVGTDIAVSNQLRRLSRR